jgi:hypothetical protein
VTDNKAKKQSKDSKSFINQAEELVETFAFEKDSHEVATQSVSRSSV